VHLTFRVHDHVWNLRSQRCFRRIEAVLEEARGRHGVRIVEFAVLGNHLHVLAEAGDSESLSHAMKGLLVRLARSLNALMDRKGAVFADHYHSRLLRTPTELVNALSYVLGNAAHHYGDAGGADSFSSASCDRERVLSRPTTWLLRHGGERARPPRRSQQHRPGGR
jgi:putative transposase